MWYLRTFELSSPSVFSELGGMHYAPDNVADTMVYSVRICCILKCLVADSIAQRNKQ